MTFKVLLTEDAAVDLQKIYTYILEHDSLQKAEYVLDQLEKKFVSLSALPERGVYPKELMALGIRDYREIFFKPYRIIYRIFNVNVYVYLIVDGRRDMQTLLQRRLLGAESEECPPFLPQLKIEREELFFQLSKNLAEIKVISWVPASMDFES